MRRRTQIVLGAYIITAGVTVCSGVVSNGCGCGNTQVRTCDIICKDSGGNFVFGDSVSVEVFPNSSVDQANTMCSEQLDNAEIQGACPAGTTPINCSCAQ